MPNRAEQNAFNEALSQSFIDKPTVSPAESSAASIEQPKQNINQAQNNTTNQDANKQPDSQGHDTRYNIVSSLGRFAAGPLGNAVLNLLPKDRQDAFDKRSNAVVDNLQNAFAQNINKAYNYYLDAATFISPTPENQLKRLAATQKQTQLELQANQMKDTNGLDPVTNWATQNPLTASSILPGAAAFTAPSKAIAAADGLSAGLKHFGASLVKGASWILGGEAASFVANKYLVPLHSFEGVRGEAYEDLAHAAVTTGLSTTAGTMAFNGAYKSAAKALGADFMSKPEIYNNSQQLMYHQENAANNVKGLYEGLGLGKLEKPTNEMSVADIDNVFNASKNAINSALQSENGTPHFFNPKSNEVMAKLAETLRSTGSEKSGTNLGIALDNYNKQVQRYGSIFDNTIQKTPELQSVVQAKFPNAKLEELNPLQKSQAMYEYTVGLSQKNANLKDVLSRFKDTTYDSSIAKSEIDNLINKGVLSPEEAELSKGFVDTQSYINHSNKLIEQLNRPIPKKNEVAINQYLQHRPQSATYDDVVDSLQGLGIGFNEAAPIAREIKVNDMLDSFNSKFAEGSIYHDKNLNDMITGISQQMQNLNGLSAKTIERINKTQQAATTALQHSAALSGDQKAINNQIDDLTSSISSFGTEQNNPYVAQLIGQNQHTPEFVKAANTARYNIRNDLGNQFNNIDNTIKDNILASYNKSLNETGEVDYNNFATQISQSEGGKKLIEMVPLIQEALSNGAELNTKDGGFLLNETEKFLNTRFSDVDINSDVAKSLGSKITDNPEQQEHLGKTLVGLSNFIQSGKYGPEAKFKNLTDTVSELVNKLNMRIEGYKVHGVTSEHEAQLMNIAEKINNSYKNFRQSSATEHYIKEGFQPEEAAGLTGQLWKSYANYINWNKDITKQLGLHKKGLASDFSNFDIPTNLIEKGSATLQRLNEGLKSSHNDLMDFYNIYHKDSPITLQGISNKLDATTAEVMHKAGNALAYGRASGRITDSYTSPEVLTDMVAKSNANDLQKLINSSPNISKLIMRTDSNGNIQLQSNKNILNNLQNISPTDAQDYLSAIQKTHPELYSDLHSAMKSKLLIDSKSNSPETFSTNILNNIDKYSNQFGNHFETFSMGDQQIASKLNEPVKNIAAFAHIARENPELVTPEIKVINTLSEMANTKSEYNNAFTELDKLIKSGRTSDQNILKSHISDAISERQLSLSKIEDKNNAQINEEGRLKDLQSSIQNNEKTAHDIVLDLYKVQDSTMKDLIGQFKNVYNAVAQENKDKYDPTLKQLQKITRNTGWNKLSGLSTFIDNLIRDSQAKHFEKVYSKQYPNMSAQQVRSGAVAKALQNQKSLNDYYDQIVKMKSRKMYNLMGGAVLGGMGLSESQEPVPNENPQIQ